LFSTLVKRVSAAIRAKKYSLAPTRSPTRSHSGGLGARKLKEWKRFDSTDAVARPLLQKRRNLQFIRFHICLSMDIFPCLFETLFRLASSEITRPDSGAKSGMFNELCV
jgi:hypothetical protein